MEEILVKKLREARNLLSIAQDQVTERLFPEINDFLVETEDLVKGEPTDLKFVPSTGTYGYLGEIYKNDFPVVRVYLETFYCYDFDFPLNQPNLKFIQNIQREYKK